MNLPSYRDLDRLTRQMDDSESVAEEASDPSDPYFQL